MKVLEMTSEEFKKKINAKKILTGTLGETTDAKSGTKIYWIQLQVKMDGVVQLEGSSWDEIYKKVPDYLKLV